MFTKHEFVEYANTIRDYSNAMTEAGELLHIEFLESRFTDPLDKMAEMLFIGVNRNLNNEVYDALMEEFWHIVLFDDIDNSDWEELYDKIKSYK